MNKKNKKIGICAWNLPFQDEALFEFVKGADLSGISPEFDYEAVHSTAQIEAWCLKWSGPADEYGIELPILGVNTLGLYGMSKKEQFLEVKRILELAILSAAAMKAEGVHLPCFGASAVNSDEELEQTIRCLEYAVTLGEKYQVQIGLESILSEEMYSKILNNIDSPVFYLLYDNENLLHSGQDPTVSYLKYSKVYRHAHIKNSNQESDMPELLSANKEYGGVGAVLEQLSNKKFSGWMLLETDYKKLKNKDEMQNMVKADAEFLFRYS